MKLTQLFKDFFASEKIGGLLLIICTLFSIAISNSDFANSYLDFWKIEFAGHSITHWINDGLMTIFFLLIGLELEREIYKGELSKLKDALLPIFAALGGVIFPALIYFYFNYNTPTQNGAGIPMATDIAFALGVLSLVGNRVPISLKVFLTALAVIDDLCAILIIALFYSKTIYWLYLALAMAILIFLFILNRLKVNTLFPYLIGGVLMWYCMLNSGVHATITGVLLAFVIPFGDGNPTSISYKLQQFLHRPVAFLILPIFALSNTAIVISGNIGHLFYESFGIGIATGLIFGKPLGIFLFSFLSVKLGICNLPEDLNWKSIFSVGILGGIGFTMSIFITMLAFDNETIVNNIKLVVLLSSLIAGTIGYFSLLISTKKQK